MNLINLSQASRLTAPNPLTLICSQVSPEETNLATVSWWTYLSFKQPLVGFAMSKKSFSGERIRETGKAVLAMPGSSIAEAVMKCGTSSGRDHKKAEEYGIELQKLPETDIMVPVHTRCAIVCTLTETVEAGDHYFYICSVEAVYGNEDEKALFAWNGYGQVKPVE